MLNTIHTIFNKTELIILYTLMDFKNLSPKHVCLGLVNNNCNELITILSYRATFLNSNLYLGLFILYRPSLYFIIFLHKQSSLSFIYIGPIQIMKRVLLNFLCPSMLYVYIFLFLGPIYNLLIY